MIVVNIATVASSGDRLAIATATFWEEKQHGGMSHGN